MITLSKKLQTFLLLFLAVNTTVTAQDCSMDGDQQKPPIDEQTGLKKTRIKPPSLSLSLINEDPFDKMITKLSFLRVSSGIEPWCQAIADYYWHERWSRDPMTLLQLRDKIFTKDLPDGGIHMVKRAITKLIVFGPPRAYNGLQTPPSFVGKSTSPVPHVVFTNTVFPPQLPVRYPTPFAPSGNFCDKPLPKDGELTPLLPQLLPEEDDRVLHMVDAPVVEKKSKPMYAAMHALPASTIRQHLQKFIAGQDEALTSLSLIIHRLLCNEILLNASQKAASKPSHCILTGPSGSGKSETVKQLSLFAKIPILHINAPCITAEGYKGTNFSSVVGNFYKANNNPKSAIIVLEEIDKLGSNRDDPKNFGTEIQKLLLSYLDGNSIATSNGTCDISNWLFIGTGAFSVLDNGRRQRSSTRKATATTHDDLKRAGFLPEFANRFKAIIPYKNHTKATMLEILTKEGSPLEEKKSEFKRFYNVNLAFEPSILEKLAEISLKVKTGVRALDTILGKVLEPYYDLATTLMGTDFESEEKHIDIRLKDIKASLEAFDVVEEKDDDAPPFGMYL